MPVFRIVCQQVENNYKDLWGSKKITWSTGTAFTVRCAKTTMLITAYHVIENAITIEIFADNSQKPYAGRCLTHCYEIDLAILEIPEMPEITGIATGAMWNALTNLDYNYENNYNGLFQNALSQGRSVSVLGFPNNEISSSLTKGNISRICPIKVNGVLPQVLIQISASLDKGNSGGPVFNGRDIHGMVLGGLTGRPQNVSYFLPMFTIQRYLKKCVIPGSDTLRLLPVCCDLGIATIFRQVIVNGESVTCPMIISVGHSGPGHGKLIKDDVIISIGGHKISQNDKLPNGFPYWQIVREKYPFDFIKLQVLRSNQIEDVIVCSYKTIEPLIPFKKEAIDNRYYIFAGMDFMPLNALYFHPLEELYVLKNSRIIDIYHKHITKFTVVGSQLIILKNIFPSEMTKGIHKRHLVLTHINDKRINTIGDVYAICENPDDNDEANIRFTFLCDQYEEIIEINHRLALLSSERIARAFIGKSYHNFGMP
jgi:Trypsin-like peptidase domain/PDZ domain